MKKSLFGYKIAEVNVIIDALREENESLNATITTLKTQIKNTIGQKSAKSILVEEDLKKLETDLIKINKEKAELLVQISTLTKEFEVLYQQNKELRNRITYLGNENEDLHLQLHKLQKRFAKESSLTSEVAITNTKDFISNKKIVDAVEDEAIETELNTNNTINSNLDMAKMRVDIINYMNKTLHNYQQLVNKSAVQENASASQTRLQNSQMINELYLKAIEFFANLSSIELEHSKHDDNNDK